MHMTASPISVNDGSAGLSFIVFQDGNFVAQGVILPSTAGTYDYPFSIADTVGLPSLIQVNVSWEGGASGGVTGSVTGNGVLTP
jgi:hypothetical protein